LSYKKRNLALKISKLSLPGKMHKITPCPEINRFKEGNVFVFRGAKCFEYPGSYMNILEGIRITRTSSILSAHQH
jgi:hypothetical protein